MWYTRRKVVFTKILQNIWRTQVTITNEQQMNGLES